MLLQMHMSATQTPGQHVECVDATTAAPVHQAPVPPASVLTVGGIDIADLIRNRAVEDFEKVFLGPTLLEQALEE